MFDAIDTMEQGLKPKGCDQPSTYRVRSGDAMSGPDASALEVALSRFGALAGESLHNSH